MKRIYRLFSIILAGGLLTACNSGDEPGAGRLPDGKYPLTLTASLDGMKSRAAGIDSWQGGEEIAVSIGDYTGKYTVNADGKTTASGAPYYWQSAAKATVTAWYPYAEGEVTYDISDQSDGYAGFDFLYAQSEGSYAAPVALAFSHQMAKVSYTLVKGQGVTDAELSAASVTVFGDKSVTVSGGRIISAAASQTDAIVPCHDAATLTGAALLAPQNMTGKPLIKVTVDGNDFIYAPAAEAAGNLQAGYRYAYTITVKANGIDVTETTGGEWTDGGSEYVSSKVIQTLYTAAELKIGDYVYSDGSFSDGGLRRAYSDGTFGIANVAPEAGKTCVGIVFHLRNDGSPTDVCDYSEFNSQPATGYIVSVDQNKSQWADSDTNGDEGTKKDVINGYKCTKDYYAKYNSTKNLYALNWCMSHSSILGSGEIAYSSWYMPSQLEYQLMRGTDGAVLAVLENTLRQASGTLFTNDYYFTSGLMGNWGNYLHMYNLKTGDTDAGYYQNAITAIYPYRAVCAFRIN